MPLSESQDLASRVDRELLQRLARKYIWWKTPDEALAEPARIMAQVMNMGDYADVQALATEAGDDVLKSVLAHADAGQFDERSWGVPEGHTPERPGQRTLAARYRPYRIGQVKRAAASPAEESTTHAMIR